MSLAARIDGFWNTPIRNRNGVVSKATGVGVGATKLGLGAVKKSVGFGVGVGRMGLEGIVKALPTAKRAVVEGVKAANPLKDVEKVYTAGKNIVSERPKWAEYKADAKKGKFLGKGNLSTLLFYGGAVATGIYPALLGLRFGLGAGGYAGKEVLTNNYVANKTSNFVGNRTYVQKGLEKVLGIKNKSLQRNLTPQKVRNSISKLENDDFYREKVQPLVIDGAIGMKGYGGLIGAKWMAGLAEKGAEKIKRNTSGKLIGGLAGLAIGGAGFIKNFAGDYISLSLGSQGVKDVYHGVSVDDVKAVPGKVKNGVAYVTDGELVADAKAKYEGVKGKVKSGFEYGKGEMWRDGYSYVVDGGLVADVKGVGTDGWDFVRDVSKVASDTVKDGWDKGKYAFGGDMKDDIKDYFAKGTYKDDAKEWGKQKVVNAADVAYRGVYDAADVLGINSSEQYAVLCSGFDKHEIPQPDLFDFSFLFGQKHPYPNDMFTAQMVRAYDHLTDMGIPKENIIVMTPNGSYSIDPTGRFYPTSADNLEKAMNSQDFSSTGSEENLKKALSHMAEKVDGNDSFMLYLIGHGLSPDKTNSFIGLKNGSDKLHDHELAEYTKGIKGGKELYYIGACQSGGFADKLCRGNDIAISSSEAKQNSIGVSDGSALGHYFLKRLKNKDELKYCSPSDVKACLADGKNDFEKERGGGSGKMDDALRRQNPQFGYNGSVSGVKWVA